MTGIAGFDAATGGGIPQGTRTILYGPPGTGKTVFALQFLWAGLRAGETVACNASDRPFGQVRDYFGSFGWDVAPFEQAGKLIPLQSFAHFAEQPRADGIDVVRPDELDDLRATCQKLSARGVSRFALGEQSQVAFSIVPMASVSATSAWMVDWAFRSKASVIEVVTATQVDIEGHKGWSLSLKAAQNIIQFRLQGGRREIRILKMEGVTHPLEWVPIEIGPTGIEMGVA